MGKSYDGEKNLKFYERLGLYFYSEESLYLLVDEADPWYIYNFPHSFEKAYFEWTSFNFNPVSGYCFFLICRFA